MQLKNHLPLKCIHCGTSDLLETQEALVCSTCGHVYPISFGVPLLVKNLSRTPSGRIISEDTARKVCEVIGIPTDPAKMAAITAILSHNYHLPDADLKAENNYFFSRARL